MLRCLYQFVLVQEKETHTLVCYTQIMFYWKSILLKQSGLWPSVGNKKKVLCCLFKRKALSYETNILRYIFYFSNTVFEYKFIVISTKIIH